MQAGLVSIITPAHNAATHIAETVASVIAQTYPHWEMVVVDHGSTDATVSIVRELMAVDPRIQLLHENQAAGLPAKPRNVALAHARGEFLAFLDADDLWHPEKLARQVAYLEKHREVDGVSCWIETFGDPGRVRRERMRMPVRRECHRSELVTGLPFHTSTLMVRQRCYAQIGGMDEDPRLRSTEDAEYFARLLTHFRIDRLRTPLTRYRLSAITAPSLSLAMVDQTNKKGWVLTEVLQEKALLSPRELRRRRSHLYYERARFSLQLLNRPFRGDLLRCALAGAPSWQALTALSLSFLPARLLWPVLMGAQHALNRSRVWRFSGSDDRA